MTVLHSLFSPVSLANIILHVVLISSLIAALFFAYGSKVEQQIVKNQTNAIVDDLMVDIHNLVPEDELTRIRPYVQQYLVAPDMSEQDAKSRKTNHDLIMETVKVLAIMGGVGVALVLGLWAYAHYTKPQYDFSLGKLIRDNLISIFFVALTEVFFLTIIASNFKSADPQAVKLQIVNTLQQFAAAAPRAPKNTK